MTDQAEKLARYQTYLKETGRYHGAIDGRWGRLSEAGTLLMLTDGPDTAVTDKDFNTAATKLGVPSAAIKAFWSVEAAGAGFFAGRPKILPERHYFSKLTQHAYDKKYPRVSYPTWGLLPYPKSQDERYDLLLAMVSLDVDAGFASCSYGAPQIMGANYRACGYTSAMQFAEAMARDEATQLQAFVAFVTNAAILPHLQRVDQTVDSWTPVAVRYNGPAQAQNRYDSKMRDAYIAFGGR